MEHEMEFDIYLVYIVATLSCFKKSIRAWENVNIIHNLFKKEFLLLLFFYSNHISFLIFCCRFEYLW